MIDDSYCFGKVEPRHVKFTAPVLSFFISRKNTCSEALYEMETKISAGQKCAQLVQSSTLLLCTVNVYIKFMILGLPL